MREILVPIDNYSATQSYRRKDNGQRDYRSFRTDGRMIEIKDDMGPVVWLLPPNFVLCKIELVEDEDEEIVEETLNLRGDDGGNERTEPEQGTDRAGSKGDIPTGGEEAS